MQGNRNLARPAVPPKVEQVEALSRAVNGLSVGNYPAIFAGFLAKGIPEDAIKPRENVFTYQAWRALGRQVRRGEHGVKVVTFVEMAKENGETGEKESFRRPWTTTVFHISQTDAIAESRGGVA
jgi:N-terminal domain of anti-restriction factor ArdC